MLAEEAEFHGIDLQYRAVVFALQILDVAVGDPRKGNDLFDRAAFRFIGGGIVPFRALFPEVTLVAQIA